MHALVCYHAGDLFYYCLLFRWKHEVYTRIGTFWLISNVWTAAFPSMIFFSSVFSACRYSWEHFRHIIQPCIRAKVNNYYSTNICGVSFKITTEMCTAVHECLEPSVSVAAGCLTGRPSRCLAECLWTHEDKVQYPARCKYRKIQTFVSGNVFFPIFICTMCLCLRSHFSTFSSML